MDTIYSFDRIIISTFQDPEILKSQLPIKEFKKLSYAFQIDEVGDFNNYQGYKSRIDIVAPTEEFLTLLFDCEKIIQHPDPKKHYKFSHIELVKDEITPTTYEAEDLYRDFSSSSRKRWATKHFTFTPIDIKIDPNKFGKSTSYSFSKLFGIRSYCRYSKVNGDPCFHREYAIMQPTPIFQKTGIRTLQDLLDFPFPSFFEKTDHKFISVSVPDPIKIGKWFLNLSNKKVLTEREKWSVGCHATFYGHRPFGEFLMMFRICQKAARAKTGRKTELEQRLVKMKNPSIFILKPDP